ncbi:hypothetical protein GOP47_0024238 [Adiantum capillus-veneris]|uniref:Uncharacterized protein n=1 Tax=Adiantum capillus-veneris TaxID=13818 RepID=A0A9D4Z438_ADICA|nr:hypothetical protein GOP47_0024238 [Adiantum capillus-veneris]
MSNLGLHNRINLVRADARLKRTRSWTVCEGLANLQQEAASGGLIRSAGAAREKMAAPAANAGGKPPNNMHNNNKKSSSGRPLPTVPLPPKRRINRHGQQQRYYGRMASNVTDYLKKVVPSHALHPSLLYRPTPSYHRKASSISDYIERPPPQNRRPYTAPDVYFGRRASNVTDHLRYIPPAHLGLHANAKSLPYFGRLATSVTDPSKYERAGDGVDLITAHYSCSRPSSARLPIPPQHVSKDVLFSALSARGDHTHATGRRSTHIGSLLKHQFAHLLGADDYPSAAGTHRPANKHTNKPAAKRPDTAPSAAITKQGNPSAQLQYTRHASSPAEQKQYHLMVASSPRARDRTSKLSKHVSNVNAAQVEPSPRSRRAAKGVNTEEASTCDRSNYAEEVGSRSSNMQVEEAEGDIGGSRSAMEGEGGAGSEGQLAEEMDMEGERAGAAGNEEGRGQSAMCDDGSSEATEELGPEKMEFVSKWVQEERPPQNWRSPQQPLNKVVDHSRRATSVTKYNIWT